MNKMIGTFTDRNVRQCVMLGQIAPKNLYDVRPDLRSMGVLLHAAVCRRELRVEIDGVL